MRKIIGKKPRYPSYLESSRTISQIIRDADAELEAEEQSGKKKRKPKKIEFIPCQECKNWVTTKVEPGKTYGYCKIGIRNCPHL